MTLISPSRGRARIGVLVPFTNVNMEADLNLMRPDGVSFHFTRMGGYDVNEVPNAEQMAGLGTSALDDPLELLTGARLDLIMYGCTSATLSHGTRFDHDLALKIRAISGALSVTAAGALVFALKALAAKNIAFASPYTPDINKAAIVFLIESGFVIHSTASISEELGNYGQAELTPDDVFKLGMRAVRSGADALVLSCTEMRSVETIERLETELNLPIVTSNQAMLYQAMNLLDLSAKDIAFGQLFKQQMPS